MRVNRRQFLAASTVAVTAPSLLPGQTTRPATTSAVHVPDDVVWHDVREWGVEGRAFDDTENYFDRLPGRAKGVVREPVWDLGRQTAGMSALFQAATEAVYVRYELLGERMAMPHMPATGVSGVDLYTRFESKWRWLATCKPAETKVVAALVTGMPAQRREFILNLPLYNGVKSMQIGVAKKASFTPVPPRKDKAILIYGTSITQGGCASRPGMAWPSILGRRLDRPVLNFGFSGNGRMEMEVAKFLAEIDAGLFVLDCMANMAKEPVKERTIAVVKLLRAAHRDTPILLLEDHPWDDNYLLPLRAKNRAERIAELKAAREALAAEGVKNLHYRAGDDLNGSDGESTVDGNHLNDLGMMRHAEVLEADFRRLLG